MALITTTDGKTLYASDLSDQSTATPGSGAPNALDMDQISSMSQADFDKFLEQHGVDHIINVSAMNGGKGKNSQDLLKEIVSGRCKIQKIDGPKGCEIQRRCKILVIELQAKIRGNPMFLTMSGDKESEHANQRITVTMHSDETPEDALRRCLSQYFDLKDPAIWTNLEILSTTQHEELHETGAYHGLTSIYDMNEFLVSVHNPKAAGFAVIGLPAGKEFTTTAKDDSNKQCTWKWVDEDFFRVIKRNTTGRVTSRRRPSQTMFDIPVVNVPRQDKKQCCVIS